MHNWLYFRGGLGEYWFIGSKQTSNGFEQSLGTKNKGNSKSFLGGAY